MSMAAPSTGHINRVSSPSTTGMALDVTDAVPAVRPSRVAVTVIVPGVSVLRTKTRLIPASVSRFVWLIEPTTPLL
jgi:hypothetical protein